MTIFLFPDTASAGCCRGIRKYNATSRHPPGCLRSEAVAYADIETVNGMGFIIVIDAGTFVANINRNVVNRVNLYASPIHKCGFSLPAIFCAHITVRTGFLIQPGRGVFGPVDIDKIGRAHV